MSVSSIYVSPPVEAYLLVDQLEAMTCSFLSRRDESFRYVALKRKKHEVQVQGGKRFHGSSPYPSFVHTTKSESIGRKKSGVATPLTRRLMLGSE